ncbi:MAG: hypothetical protein ACRDBQ_18700 [Shewanella sp.]
MKYVKAILIIGVIALAADVAMGYNTCVDNGYAGYVCTARG